MLVVVFSSDDMIPHNQYQASDTNSSVDEKADDSRDNHPTSKVIPVVLFVNGNDNIDTMKIVHSTTRIMNVMIVGNTIDSQ